MPDEYGAELLGAGDAVAPGNATDGVGEARRTRSTYPDDAGATILRVVTGASVGTRSVAEISPTLAATPVADGPSEEEEYKAGKPRRILIRRVVADGSGEEEHL